MIKALVAFTYLMEMAQTFVMTSDAFRKFGTGFGSVDALNAIMNEWLVVPVFTAISAY